jgi:hypothetical protein
MDNNLMDELYNEINMLNASLEVYSDFVSSRATSKDEKENIELKLELVKEEALKHNLRVRRVIDKLGY